jgi:hypothetical protein
MIREKCPPIAAINTALPLRIFYYPGDQYCPPSFVVIEKTPDTPFGMCRCVGDRDTALAVYRARERELNALLGFNAPMKED